MATWTGHGVNMDMDVGKRLRSCIYGCKYTRTLFAFLRTEIVGTRTHIHLQTYMHDLNPFLITYLLFYDFGAQRPPELFNYMTFYHMHYACYVHCRLYQWNDGTSVTVNVLLILM